jgi:hypothetical protein
MGFDLAQTQAHNNIAGKASSAHRVGARFSLFIVTSVIRSPSRKVFLFDDILFSRYNKSQR